ncbi:hypothetical protein SAMN05421810_110156 [Amycolatopsis arida]|uniref:DUF6286 domain-containing protein n=1 Tax=Amycolatopsis arida TaxID=587909 RepID=A0A1I5ZVE6_9PSEU|nr:DUF6286 domain-containing protein [Amycolatopsis arida]TDX89389.1 hypothetical protein CLV69_110157 [Amycolatopsis arida]SFQ60313.1 hypothetical protein SAMN05421810_110156 [Amycolatopsis arida]
MRVFVRFLSALLALAVVAAGGFTVLEVGWHWWRPAQAPLVVPWPRWLARLGEVGWDATQVRVLAGAAVAAGLALILVAATARRRLIRLHDPAPGIAVTMSPRSLARLVGHRVREQATVDSATVVASAGRVRVRAASRSVTEEELRPRLTSLVAELVTDLPLARRPAVSVVVDSPKDRR